MSHEQIPIKTDEIILDSNNNNNESYHSSKVVVGKKYDSNLQQAGTKIEREQAKYIKTNVINNGETMWRGYGKEFRRLLQKGIDQDQMERSKLQQSTKTTTSLIGGKRNYRGDVVVRLIQIQEILKDSADFTEWDKESQAQIPYTKFSLSQIESAVKTVLGNVDPRTILLYVQRVTKGCQELDGGYSGKSIWQLRNFINNKFGREKTKIKTNLRLEKFL